MHAAFRFPERAPAEASGVARSISAAHPAPRHQNVVLASEPLDGPWDRARAPGVRPRRACPPWRTATDAGPAATTTSKRRARRPGLRHQTRAANRARSGDQPRAPCGRGGQPTITYARHRGDAGEPLRPRRNMAPTFSGFTRTVKYSRVYYAPGEVIPGFTRPPLLALLALIAVVGVVAVVEVRSTSFTTITGRFRPTRHSTARWPPTCARPSAAARRPGAFPTRRGPDDGLDVARPPALRRSTPWVPRALVAFTPPAARLRRGCCCRHALGAWRRRGRRVLRLVLASRRSRRRGELPRDLIAALGVLR